MRFLVVGLGSMGKRRIRNLRALGHANVAGFDPRQDRRDESVSKYGIVPFAEYEDAVNSYSPDAMVISTGPALHMQYAQDSVGRKIPCFIEASVVHADRVEALHNQATEHRVVVAPSCTMRYSEGVKCLQQLIKNGTIGRPLNINYQHGQYLPDWHPWEKVTDFYVGQRDTGGCREMVAFELTWLNTLFGNPKPVTCVKEKITDIEADIDDIYHFVLRYPDGLLANITIEVVSRPVMTRELRILGTHGQIVFSDHEHVVRFKLVGDQNWTTIDVGMGTQEPGYVKPEEPYIAEMADFVLAVENNDQRRFPNTLAADAQILRLLERLDKISESTSGL